MQEELGEQGGFAAARVPDEAQVTVSTGAFSVLQKLAPNRFAAAEHEAFGALLDERLHRGVFLGELVQLLRGLRAEFLRRCCAGCLALTRSPNAFSPVRRSRRVIPLRRVDERVQTRGPTIACFSFASLLALRCRRFAELARVFLRHRGSGRGIAKVEEGEPASSGSRSRTP